MTASVIDTHTLQQLIDSTDLEFVKDLAATFLDDTPTQIREMRQSLQNREMEIFVRAAHSLKSTSANFGALGLSERAKDLEHQGRSGDLDGIWERLDSLVKEYERVEAELKAL